MCNKFEDFVNVSVRIKPSQEDACLKVISKEPPVLLVSDRSQTYHFDNIFTEEVTQKDVYEETVKPLVENVRRGYNCTVFAYGQTGTGKTYTMGSNPDVRHDDDLGLISRTLEDLFALNNEEEETEIFISFIEIYNEKVFDLLTHNKTPLSVKGFTVQGFEKIQIHNNHNALALLKTGGRNRHTGETKQNSNSSRSHAVFTIYCNTRNSESVRMAKLNLVDLAGSESVRKTGNQGSSLHEGININKGLLSLGQVMTALSTNSAHVPYRQSIITTILRDSLDKKNFVSLMACVSPNMDDLGETLQTLEFSQRVKKMKSKPEVNHIVSQYRKDNPMSFPQCPQRGITPAKRSNSNMYETPFKKPKTFLPMIQEPINTTNSSNLEISPKSISMSSISSDLQQNFSPVIKKYMDAMESSIMRKLEDVIRNTLQRPTRSSCNKENASTPSFSWDKVSKVVRSEILQFSSQISRATSSPIDNCTLLETSLILSSGDRPILQARKMLTYEDSPSQIEQSDESNNLNDDVVFKVPAPVKKRKVKNLDNSPVERRGSIRLQNKQKTPELQRENVSGRRRSVRLQLKADLNRTIIEDEGNMTMKKPKTKRKLAETNTPCPNCMKKPRLKIGEMENSPITLRMKRVLKILNTGTLKEIETLHTIGIKTAEKIQLFRSFKGPFKSISGLCEMPSWTKRTHERFLSENFLKHENNDEI